MQFSLLLLRRVSTIPSRRTDMPSHALCCTLQINVCLQVWHFMDTPIKTRHLHSTVLKLALKRIHYLRLSRPTNNFYSAFGKSLCTYKRCWNWCARTSMQAWTRLNIFANTFRRSAFGKSLCTYKMCWKWCTRATSILADKSTYRSLSAQRLSESTVCTTRQHASGPSGFPKSLRTYPFWIIG
jgi:hypothetical protein